jgi:hypothetical protein
LSEAERPADTPASLFQLFLVFVPSLSWQSFGFLAEKWRTKDVPAPIVKIVELPL